MLIFALFTKVFHFKDPEFTFPSLVLCIVLLISSQLSVEHIPWNQAWDKVPMTLLVILISFPYRPYLAYNSGSAYRQDPQYSPPAQKRSKNKRSSSRRGLQSSDEEADDEQDGKI